MTTSGKPARPERAATDESLKVERKNLDRALGDLRSDRQDEADELVDLARERADAVLGAARQEADERRANAGARGVDVVAERSIEDAALRQERAAADAQLAREREAETRALAALLPLERETTDRFLLTERARSDDSLANRDEFLAIVGHDLRNLLSGIVLDATLTAERAAASDSSGKSAAAMQRIQRYAARMNRLIGDLVDVVSIDAGKLAVDRSPCDVAVLVAEAVDGFATVAAERGVTLDLDVAPGAMLADLDHDRMLQVLANLLSNALKFTPHGGRVVVHAEPADGSIRLSVGDTGPGIPANAVDSVFERFWQADHRDRRGLGLGLYISRSLVEAHGGTIWVESEPGVGSTFHVSVPA
jgi:signal transduction histidine kinase